MLFSLHNSLTSEDQKTGNPPLMYKISKSLRKPKRFKKVYQILSNFAYFFGIRTYQKAAFEQNEMLCDTVILIPTLFLPSNPKTRMPNTHSLIAKLL